MKELFLKITKLAARKFPPSLKRWLYRNEFVSNLIRQKLNEALPMGVREIEVVGGILRGYRLMLDLQKEKDYWLGTYEQELQQCVLDYVKPGWIVYDVGANIGYLSLIFQKIVGEQGKVIAFEPFPDNIKRLKQNVVLNGKEAYIEAVNKAVVDDEKAVQFILGPSNATGQALGSAGKKIDSREVINVEGISLDGYLQNNPQTVPDLIKIDIEGGEVLALPGMEKILKDIRPLIFIEIHGRDAAETVWGTLLAESYHLLWMTKGYPAVGSLNELGRKAYLVAVPR